MKAIIETKEKRIYVYLPIEVEILNDILQELDGQSTMQVRVGNLRKETLLPTLTDMKMTLMTTDIFKLNRFAELVESLDDMEAVALDCLLYQEIINGFDEIMDTIPELDKVPIWYCHDNREMIKFVAEEGLLPGITYYDEALQSLLDAEQVWEYLAYYRGGMLMHARFYCEPFRFLDFKKQQEEETESDAMKMGGMT